MITFTLLDPRMTESHLGIIPEFFSENDPRPAREQAQDNYAHGGGWDRFDGFRMLANGALQYPGDPPMHPLAEARLRDEVIRFYNSAWVAIVQPDGSFEVSRMD
jgi:hypothetical protein